MTRTFVKDPTTVNGWGTWDDALGFVVTCEECGQVVGKGVTIAEAQEDADDNDAHTDNSDEGSGDTYCDGCYTGLMDEAMRDAAAYLPTYRAEHALRDQQARADDYLAQADMAFDAARDRGEF